jgi:hypothetical protein
MALPILEKTWQYDVNQVVTATGIRTSEIDKVIYQLKASLIGFASNPWTVVSSANASSAGAADYWASYTDVGENSWIVLQNASSSLQLMIYVGGYTIGGVLVSPEGLFTGGSVGSPPTATDSITLLSSEYLINWTSTMNHILHVMMSSTGDCTRAFVMGGGVVKMLMCVETMSDSPIANKAAAFYQSSASYPNASEFITHAQWSCVEDGVNVMCYTGTECFNGVPVAQAASGGYSNINSAYVISALSIHCTTSGHIGRFGRIADLYIGSNTLVTGSTFPATPDDKEFILIRQFVLPWNGSSPVLT